MTEREMGNFLDAERAEITESGEDDAAEENSLRHGEWSFEDYWAVVFGAENEPKDMACPDEGMMDWIEECECDSWRNGAGYGGEPPLAWSKHRRRAFALLLGASASEPHAPGTVLLNDGEWIGLLDEFLGDNETLDVSEVMSLRGLDVGDTFYSGGGAQPAWWVTRIA
jgi:hypothetical protein